MHTNQTRAFSLGLKPASRGRFPKLEPYRRCRCGQCRECLDNERWDRIFARFHVEHYGDEKGLFQSTLRGL